MFLLQNNPNNSIGIIVQLFTKFGEAVMNALPGIFGGFLLIIIGIILATIISKILFKVSKALGVEKIENWIKKIDLFKNIEIKPDILLAKIAYWVIVLIFFVAATEVMGLKNVSEGIGKLLAYIPRLISALIVFIVGAFVATFIKGIVNAACESMGLSASKIISNVLFYFLLIVTSITALTQAGLDTKMLTDNFSMVLGSILFAFTLGYGLASKDIMANFLASFYSREKFQIGQRIRINEIEGIIIGIDSTSLTLQSEKRDSRIVIPLAQIMNATVEVF